MILATFLTLAPILVVFILGGLRVVDQYERGVILTFGRYAGVKNPGLTWILLGVQRMIKIDLRINSIDIPRQEVITKDNVTVGINAVVYFRVVNPVKAFLEIKDYYKATALYAQAALRDVIGGIELDDLLAERKKIATEIRSVVDVATDPWGISVTAIKIQDIELPADMKKVMAKQAEAERQRRAVIIRAEGEMQAAENLSKAAEILNYAPGGLSLRTLKTIDNLQADPSKMVIFALPTEVLEGFKILSAQKGEGKEGRREYQKRKFEDSDLDENK